MTTREQLIELYEKDSKHSHYQVLPKVLKDIIDDSEIEVSTRYEVERLNYLLSHVEVANKSVLDIGANTGFFSFEMLAAGAEKVHYIEGNEGHVEFVKVATQAVGLEQKMKITGDYYDFKGKSLEHYDIALLFNVLHHLGDDYGDKKATIEQAKSLMISQLNNMSEVADTIVFQLGFNWHGNISTPLFKKGTKEELVEFIREGVKNYWDIKSIGIAERQSGSIVYNELNSNNIRRDDSLGEFLNRPIFIMKSLNRRENVNAQA